MGNIELNKSLLRAKDVCELFSISRSTVDSWVNSGILHKKKIGKNVYFYKDEVLELMR